MPMERRTVRSRMANDFPELRSDQEFSYLQKVQTTSSKAEHAAASGYASSADVRVTFSERPDAIACLTSAELAGHSYLLKKKGFHHRSQAVFCFRTLGGHFSAASSQTQQAAELTFAMSSDNP